MKTILGKGIRKDVFLSEALPHLDALYRMAVRRCRNPATAQDLVQETFKEAWKSFNRYQPGSNCRAWLFKILLRVAGKESHRERSMNQLDLEQVQERNLAVVPNLEEKLDRKAVLETLASLPKSYRTVLVLADVEEFAYREISEILDVPIGTVMSRLNRARGYFRERFLARISRAQSA